MSVKKIPIRSFLFSLEPELKENLHLNGWRLLISFFHDYTLKMHFPWHEKRLLSITAFLNKPRRTKVAGEKNSLRPDSQYSTRKYARLTPSLHTPGL